MGSSTASSGPVIAITGTSGAGKGTLEVELMRRLPELELAVSATTRERRPNERDGREYHFVSADELERRLRERATESGGEIEERLAVAREQLALEDEFDHVIVNDDLRHAVDELKGVVARELRATGSMSRP